MSDEPLRPRTDGERRAYAVGAAAALGDVVKLGLGEAVKAWQPILELELGRMEETSPSLGAWCVHLVDGPAADYEYVTMINPDPMIYVAPVPSHDDGKWFRALDSPDSPPWPGQQTYRRDVLPDRPSSEADVEVKYYHQP